MMYNLTTGAWTNLTGTLHRRQYMACIHLEIGGAAGVLVAAGDIHPKTSEFYNLETGTWSFMGNLTHNRIYSPEMVRLSGRYFIVGGGPASVEEFHPGNMTWTTAGLPGLLLSRDWSPGVAAVPSKLFNNCN